MGWRDDYKKRFLEVSRRVIRHDAPEEIEQETAKTPGGFTERWLLFQYIEETVKQIMSEPFWPKFARKRAVICPVTGIETDHPFGLHPRAWDLINKGVTYEIEQAEANADRKWYCFHYRWGHGLTSEDTRGPDRYAVQYKPLEQPDELVYSDLDDLIFRLIDRPVLRSLVRHDWTPEAQDWIWLPYEPYDYKLLSQGEVYRALLTPAEAETIRQIMTMVRWQQEEVEREARAEGANLLLALNKSPDAIERFNAVQDERR